MRILFLLAQERALVSFQFLAKAREVQSTVYSTKTAMNTYKKLRRLFLYLLYLSTPRPAGSAKKTARLVVGVHSQVVAQLHCPLRINTVMKLTADDHQSHLENKEDWPRRFHDIVICCQVGPRKRAGSYLALFRLRIDQRIPKIRAGSNNGRISRRG